MLNIKIRLIIINLLFILIRNLMCLARVSANCYGEDNLHISSNGELAALSSIGEILLYRLGQETASKVRVVPTSGMCERVIALQGVEAFLVYNAESGSLRLVGASVDEDLPALVAQCRFFAATAELLVASKACHLHGYDMVRHARALSVTFPWTISGVALTVAHALCGLANGAVALVSVPEGDILSVVRVLSGPVGYVLVSPDKQTVLMAMRSECFERFGERDNALCVCAMDTLLRLGTVEDTLYMNLLGFIEVDDEPARLVAQDAHFALCLLDVDTLQPVKRETSFHGKLLELVMLPAPLQRFVTVACDGTLQLHDMAINCLAEYAVDQVASRAKLLDGPCIAVA